MKLEFLPEKRFMERALELALEAGEAGEVPVGAVIVSGGQVIGEGRNRRESLGNALAHAEIEAIARACERLGTWRLSGCQLYVTLEPCQMCAGAIVQSRIQKVVMGCRNPKAGCAGSVLNLLQIPEFNHQAEIQEGVLGQQCSELLKNFFRELRSGKVKKNNGTFGG